MLPEWNLKIDTGRHHGSSDHGATWRPEDDPASSGPMPTFARRRKGKAAATSQLEGGAGGGLPAQHEEQLAERVAAGAAPNGDLTGLSFALLHLLQERVRIDEVGER